MTYNSLYHIFHHWLCHLATFILILVRGQVTKPIVTINYYTHVILGVKRIFDKVTSWLQLLSKHLVTSARLHVVSDWPRTFFTLQVYLAK